MRVHHGCGHDPVREHIARVDLSDLITFLRVGEAVAPVPTARLSVVERHEKCISIASECASTHDLDSTSVLADRTTSSLRVGCVA